MVRNNYELTPEIRCRECGWYESDDNWCVFWNQYHTPNGFCDEGVDKCCRNCECSVIEGDKHRCMEKNEIVDAMNVCDEWDRWTLKDD
jgi:hypothetical protein